MHVALSHSLAVSLVWLASLRVCVVTCRCRGSASTPRGRARPLCARVQPPVRLASSRASHAGVFDSPRGRSAPHWRGRQAAHLRIHAHSQGGLLLSAFHPLAVVASHPPHSFGVRWRCRTTGKSSRSSSAVASSRICAQAVRPATFASEVVMLVKLSPQRFV